MAKKTYTKKAVNDAFRDVQTKMRKEKDLISKSRAGVHRMQDIGMKARATRTKAISAAAKKHGVPKSQIIALKPINPGELASRMSRQMKSSGQPYGQTGRRNRHYRNPISD